MREQLRKQIRRSSTIAGRVAENYRGKPVSLEEAVCLVYKYRERARAKATAGRH